MLSISTSWIMAKRENINEAFEDIIRAGLNAVELNVEITADMFPDIEKHVNSGKITVTSLHNFCPMVDNIPEGRSLHNAYSLAAQDDAEFENAVANTKRTIHHAARVGAKAVVMHMGSVKTETKGQDFYAIYKNLTDTAEYKAIQNKLFMERSRLKKPFIDRVKKAIELLLPHAEAKGVDICIENRYFYEEIPNFEEVGMLLTFFSSPRLWYWHDLGHAQTQENMGFGDHYRYFEEYSDYMRGMHIHDTTGISDHRLPGDGSLDYKTIAKFIKGRNELIKVLELFPKYTPEDIKRGVKFLKQNNIK